MKRQIVMAFAVVLSGCVAQVWGSRTQTPLTVITSGTEVALVNIDVPAWVSPPSTHDDVRATFKEGLVKAFEGTQLHLVDQTSAGKQILIGPKIPVVMDTQPGLADLNIPWPVSARAVGNIPVVWKMLEGPKGMSVDSDTGKISWTPREEGQFRAVFSLTNSFSEPVQWAFSGLAREAQKKKPVTERDLGTPWVSAEAEFVAMPPGPMPGTAPLLLGVQVFSVKESVETMPGGMQRPIVNIEAIYSLWTRDGREVETRRVNQKGLWNAPLHSGVRFVPRRDRISAGDDDLDERKRWASLEKEKLFADTAHANVAAFFLPYGNRKVSFSAQLDETNPDLKPGIQLSNKEDFEGALKQFEAVSAKSPTHPGAFYNMGVMCEVLGRDEEAAQYYQKAVALKDDGMYVRQLESVQSRLKHRRVVELK